MRKVTDSLPQFFEDQMLPHQVAKAIDGAEDYASRELMALGAPLQLLDQARTRVLATLNCCESPIEKAALVALGYMIVPGVECFPPAIHDTMSGDAWPNKAVVICPQFVIGRYRLDFLVQVMAADGQLHRFAVETDGAEFHSSIQARARDAARDEYLKALGIRTVRYSGSQVNRLSHKLAHEIAVIIQEMRGAA